MGITSIKKVTESLLNYIMMVPAQRTIVLDRLKVLAGKLLVVPDSKTPVLHAGGERTLADLLRRLDKAPEIKLYN